MYVSVFCLFLRVYHNVSVKFPNWDHEKQHKKYKKCVLLPLLGIVTNLCKLIQIPLVPVCLFVYLYVGICVFICMHIHVCVCILSGFTCVSQCRSEVPELGPWKTTQKIQKMCIITTTRYSPRQLRHNVYIAHTTNLMCENMLLPVSPSVLLSQSVGSMKQSCISSLLLQFLI
jgi:hypothetical protein